MYNLLLVDDEPLIKVAFQSAVEWGKNGFLLAATASNGQEALHIVETQHIDAVITDLKMPGMDGLALIHELKKRSFQFVKEYSPKSLRNREGFWYNRRKPPREAPSWKSTPKTPAAKQWLLT